MKLNNTPQTNGYTMKVDEHRPFLKPEDIYALAHKDVSKRKALDRLNRGHKTTVTYTDCPTPHHTAVNEVNADAPAKQNTAEPTDNFFNAVGHPKHLAKKAAYPGSKPPPSNELVLAPCCKHWKKGRQTDMDYRID